MENYIISGIQQIGIGVDDVMKAWKWYAKYFGMDVRIFEDDTVAELMLPYTGGMPQKRHAALAMNLQGGSGFEIWQYTDRVPQKAGFEIQLGDLGIFAAKIKAKDVQETYSSFHEKGIGLASQPQESPEGTDNFFLKDPYDNHFQVVPSSSWHKNEKKLTGGAYGAIIGVSDIDNSLVVYRDILGYDQVVYDKTGQFDDFASLIGGDGTFRRVLLRPSKKRTSGFAPLFGSSEIELVQAKSRQPKKIYENRFWGDIGFIHLCFDISGMGLLEKKCKEKGYDFTVNSDVKHNTNDSFDMGEAAGHFSYIEDPDGTLIEFVETHRVPIIKKLGWYLNLRGKDPSKPVPNWVIKGLSLNKVKF
jgi:catechol 2,3-dioxygenase-like lactoylglutathione lyase family enzyme